MTEPVVLFRRDGHVATVTINRPDRRNAVDAEVVRELRAALERAQGDGDTRVVVVTGAGERAFCAGGDLSGSGGRGLVDDHFERAGVGRLFDDMRAARLPLIARLNGSALGGGFGLALACDLVVAADDVQLGMPEVDVGLWPFVITAVVQRDLPRKVALELMLSGRRMSAAEAARWGIVNRVAPRADLDREVDALAATIASKSPAAVRLGKSSFYRAEDMAWRDALDYLASMLTLGLQTEDAAEGVSAFLQKRAPQWKGR